MKRYRILSFDFDTGPSLLSLEIQETWEDSVKELHLQNKEKIRQELLAQFGQVGGEDKIKNYIDIGNKPISIIAFHNKFMEQTRQSFITGSFYPALTGACALGERILNHLILNLRDSYKGTPEYAKVYRKNSFDNWDIPIDTLEKWDVLLPEVATDFRKLRDLRHKAIHFNPDTDTNDRPLALEAIKTLTKIIEGQFGAFGQMPWFISGTAGASFLKKDVEHQPFIKSIYIPNCALVSPYHELELVPKGGQVQVLVKDKDVDAKEITDEEFKELYNNKTP